MFFVLFVFICFFCFFFIFKPWAIRPLEIVTLDGGSDLQLIQQAVSKMATSNEGDRLPTDICSKRVQTRQVERDARCNSSLVWPSPRVA